MALDPKENHEEVKEKMQKERRNFLKKTVYSAPTVIALGGLLKPRKANADDFGAEPSDVRASGW